MITGLIHFAIGQAKCVLHCMPKSRGFHDNGFNTFCYRVKRNVYCTACPRAGISMITGLIHFAIGQAKCVLHCMPKSRGFHDNGFNTFSYRSSEMCIALHAQEPGFP